jgi:tetratricopeptide (TPR) repeat protein
VALNPSSQFARQLLSSVSFFRHELDAFFAEAERALALNPNDASSLAVIGRDLHYAGDKRGIELVRKAIALDPFHPTWFHFPIANYHFGRGEYEEALKAARKAAVPGVFQTQIYLAAIYAELGRQGEAQSALEELLRLYPGFTTEKLIEERQKWNESEDMLNRWVAALRKAGLPEGTEA